jgi:hypothetical protein
MKVALDINAGAMLSIAYVLKRFLQSGGAQYYRSLTPGNLQIP